ncbi:hypothetical protein [Nitrosomonas marina]|uniref:Uncharacterized protein n=1 Tax=Nitrosomonas marina TaxID=917 RepID=A0A1H8ITS9_9PROT|nr:hypothetical protein [Nitrosomonas marina]SEN72200.1 hypothetical protein SAMN05216325_14111 [Nitrosomonas marina]
MRKIEVGAPALQGEARQTVQQVFGESEFPLMVTVTSRMPCVITIPEINGLTLDTVCSADGSNSKHVQVNSIDQLTRAVSSMEQIATMNNLKHALTIEAVSDEGDESEEPDSNPDGEKPDPDGGSAGGENPGGQGTDDDKSGKQGKGGGSDDQNSQQPEANKSGAGATKTAEKSGSSGSKAKKGD